MAVGMLEAFELAEAVGDKALSIDELLFMADARRRSGCRSIRSTLSSDDRRQVMALGMKCKTWKEENR